MGHRDPPIRHHDHQISQAQFEAPVPAHAQNDDLSVEVPTFKHIFDRDDSLHLFIIARTLAFAPEPKKQPVIAETGSQEEAGAPEVLIDDDIDHAEVQVTPSRF